MWWCAGSTDHQLISIKLDRLNCVQVIRMYHCQRKFLKGLSRFVCQFLLRKGFEKVRIMQLQVTLALHLCQCVVPHEDCVSAGAENAVELYNMLNRPPCWFHLTTRSETGFQASWVKLLLYFSEICNFVTTQTDVSVCSSSDKHAVIMGNWGDIPIPISSGWGAMPTHPDHDFVNYSHGSFYYELFLWKLAGYKSSQALYCDLISARQETVCVRQCCVSAFLHRQISLYWFSCYNGIYIRLHHECLLTFNFVILMV